MDAVFEVLVRYGYLVVFVGVLAEQIGLPLPSEPLLLATGALIGGGRLSLGLVLTVATVASIAGDTAWYWIGRRGGARVLGWLCRITLEPDSCVRKTERLFGAHGARSLLVAKFVPGFSMAAPPLAGIVGMPFHEFLVFTGLGGLLWAGAFVGAGWVFHAQLELVAAYAEELGSWAIALAGAALAAHVVWKCIARQRFLRKMRIARITPEELKARLDRGEKTWVVDLRDRIDFEAAPSVIPGALHLSPDELETRHREIPRGHDIVLYCT
jgi:membrane protein DedA with SNARE-associated domain